MCWNEVDGPTIVVCFVDLEQMESWGAWFQKMCPNVPCVVRQAN